MIYIVGFIVIVILMAIAFAFIETSKTLGIVIMLVALSLIYPIIRYAPEYTVWSQSMVGKAELARAEQNRQIRIEEAKSEFESAKLLNLAEIERAKGVAEANKIIGSSLKGNDEYIRYLWIQTLKDSNNERIYIPTEANLPILEAK